MKLYMCLCGYIALIFCWTGQFMSWYCCCLKYWKRKIVAVVAFVSNIESHFERKFLFWQYLASLLLKLHQTCISMNYLMDGGMWTKPSVNVESSRGPNQHSGKEVTCTLWPGRIWSNLLLCMKSTWWGKPYQAYYSMLFLYITCLSSLFP